MAPIAPRPDSSGSASASPTAARRRSPTPPGQLWADGRSSNQRVSMPIHAELLRHATERPDQPALAIDGRSLSYGELHLRANAIYRFLQEVPRSPRRTLDLPGVERL